MKAEQLFEAINGAEDEYVEQMMEAMQTPAALRGKKRLPRTLLLAAALSLLLGATAFAAFRGMMLHREPSPTDEPVYFITDGGTDGRETVQVNFGDAAMILHFETDEAGFRHAFRLTALPEGVTVPDTNNIVPCLPDPAFSGLIPIETAEDVLRLQQMQPTREPDMEKLAEMGLTLEEAESLRYSAEGYRNGVFCLCVDIDDLDILCGHDLVLGWLGGEATVVREDAFGPYQLLEVEVSGCEKDPQALRCLFLFEPEEQYLLYLIADPAMFSFEELESIAAGTEVVTTKLKVSGDAYSDMNFSVLGLARG